MFRKSVEEMVAVTLKFFFDIDSSFCYHAFVVLFILFDSFKLFFQNCVQELNVGCQTVLRDMHSAKSRAVNARNRLMQTNTYASVKVQLRNLKEAMADKISLNWE